MLLGNYSVLYKSPGRWQSGGATGQGMDRPAFNQPGSQRGRYIGEARLYRQSAFPDGYGPGSAIVIQQKAGGIAAFTTTSGTGSLSNGNLAGGRNADATIAGVGTMAADVLGSGIITVTLFGSGGVTADGLGAGIVVATLAGSGLASGDGSALGNIGGSCTGNGTLSGDVVGALNATATLLGMGYISDAAGGLIVEALATLAGTGGLTGGILGKWEMVAGLAGSGSITAAAGAAANLVAALAGAASLSLDITATGALSATIEIGAQGELTPAGLAAALLDGADAIETGLTLRQALRIIAAATAGKVSGGGTTTITFRNAEADDVDRIVATVDSNGNRTAITLDLD